MSTRHRLLSLLVENHPGVLNKVSSMIRRRGMNITSLSVGETDDETVSRMTVAIDVGRAQADQAVKQLYKLIELLQIVDIFGAKIADVGIDTMILEMSGAEDQVDTFLELIRPFGVKEVARSGTVALAKGREGLRLSGKHQGRASAQQPDLEAADIKRRTAGVLVGD